MGGLNFDHPHIEVGDINDAASNWRVEGASHLNTDRGRLYVIRNGATLEVYKDVALSLLVASGPDAPGSDVVLTEANSSLLTVSLTRGTGDITGGTSLPRLTLWVWLCDQTDLEENEADLTGLLIRGERDFTKPLREMMRRFLTRFADVYPPPPLVGHPHRWAPPPVEQGSRGEQEETAFWFWTLNNQGQHELTGLGNPGDYRQWAIHQTLAILYQRKANTGLDTDARFSRGLAMQAQADRLWDMLHPWVDIDRDRFADRAPTTRTTRLRRG